MPEDLQLQFYTSPFGLYLTARGRLDATTANHLAKAIGVALHRFPAGRLTLDVSHLDTVDAAGVAMLVLLRLVVARQGVDLNLTEVPAHIRSVIVAARADQLLASPALGSAMPPRVRPGRRFVAVRAPCLRPPPSPRRPGSGW
jgi:anti-anti-sigma factor